MRSFRTALPIVVSTLAVAGLTACVDTPVDPIDGAGDESVALSMNPNGPPAPGGVFPVTFAGNALTVWPWTGKDFQATVSDPLNILLTGEVDVLSVRAALRALNGDRTAFGLPNQFPFNCTWTDASGEMQSAYTAEGGWVANPVQLQCGYYSPMRFHIRLFPAGDHWVVAGTHLDLLIPGTIQHRVISWELAEQLVTIDFIRSGLVNPVTGVGHVPLAAPGPTGEVIEAPLYDALPPTFQALLGVVPDGSGNYRALSDGASTVLNVLARTPVVSERTESDFTVMFDQAIPRPLCATGPGDYVYVHGPVDISTRVWINEQGQMESHNLQRGTLDITSLSDGSTFRAQLSQIDDTGINAAGVHVNSVTELKALPPGTGFRKGHLLAGPNGLAKSTLIERCN